jgi:hypothetical protein
LKIKQNSRREGEMERRREGELEMYRDGKTERYLKRQRVRKIGIIKTIKTNNNILFTK